MGATADPADDSAQNEVEGNDLLETDSFIDQIRPPSLKNVNKSKKYLPPKLKLTSIAKELVRGRTTSSMWKADGLDPFQVFEVEHESCLEFQVTIHRGEGITKGSFIQDYIDTPDPYVILRVPGSSNKSKRTTQLDNVTNPVWEESFTFFLDPGKEHNLQVILMDANYTLDEELGEDAFLVNTLSNDVPVEHVFTFKNGSKLHATLFLTKNKEPDLRFSLALCEQERAFLQIRRHEVLRSMKNLLGDRAPEKENQVPIMAVLGSGGGFRAMMCLSGAVRALHETGVLSCASYISGLSGSSWYISHLYSHESFGNVSADKIAEEIKDAVTSGWKWRLKYSPIYFSHMLKKYKLGQPISFTDFFGHLLGDVLLKERKNSKLTDQRKVVSQGKVPFPLYTCLHAKKEVSCKAFSEWVEFSPYEIGIAKYGTFMKSEHFGSKFLMGKLIKDYPESPLHFLQGVWGSAFTILVKRLVLEGSQSKDMVQMMRENVSSEREFHEKYDTNLTTDHVSDSDTEDEDDIVGKDDSSQEEDEGTKIASVPTVRKISEEIQEKLSVEVKEPPKRKISTGNLRLPILTKKTETDSKKLTKGRSFEFPTPKNPTRKISSASDPGVMNNGEENGLTKLQRKGAIKGSNQVDAAIRQSRRSDPTTPNNASISSKKWNDRRQSQRIQRAEKKLGGPGIMSGIKDSLMTVDLNPFNQRTGRAGEILNPFRGLSLKNSFPLSPFVNINDSSDETDSDSIGAGCRYEALDNNAKKLFIVDSGLAFNSPYPLLLRPQRAVDIYLSFDFSYRKSDAFPPFKELLLAEKWACQNKVPFPPVEKQIELYKNDGHVREVYVFKNEADDTCPVILHFPLVNHTFRTYKEPGVMRATEEEVEFGDFKIFDDPLNIYASTNFCYEDIQFERLTKLMEYNARNCLQTIKDELALEVQRKKRKIDKCMKMDSIALMALKNNHSDLSPRIEKGLRLKIAEDRKLRLLQERQASVESDSSDYADALEYQTASDESSSKL